MKLFLAFLALLAFGLSNASAQGKTVTLKLSS